MTSLNYDWIRLGIIVLCLASSASAHIGYNVAGKVNSSINLDEDELQLLVNHERFHMKGDHIDNVLNEIFSIDIKLHCNNLLKYLYI